MTAHVLGALALLLTPAATTPEAGASRPSLLVRVAVDTPRALDAGMLSDVTAGARQIWRRYVDVTFSPEGIARGTIADDELTLVLTGQTLGDGGGLGWIAFVDGHPSRTMMVSTEAAERLMQASSWRGRPFIGLPRAVRREFLVKALSHAVAHEIGHYLLKSTVHARRGLMRARVTADDIMRARQTTDLLEAEDVRRLDRRLLESADTAAASRPPA